jgi:TRAP-type C4-dicarboxylate transport system substrate-binding protein
MIRKMLCSAIAILALASSTVLAAAETKELKFSLFTPDHHWAMDKVFRPFAEEIEQKTNGEIKIVFFTGGALGGSNEQLSIVQSGLADLTWFPTVYARNRFPVSESVLLPFFFDNATDASRAMSAVQREYLEPEYDTVKLISFSVTSPSALLTSKPVTSLADLSGLNLRGSGGGQTKLLGDLGANVVSVAVSDTYLSLQRGTIDGTIFPLASAPGYNLEEVIKYVNRLSFSATPLAILGNMDMWDSLTPEQQEIFMEAGRHASENMGAGYDAEDEAGLQKILDAGGEVTTLSEEEQAQIVASGKALWTAWADDMKAKGFDADAFLAAVEAAK